jgi:hypothetical protein
LARPGDLLAIIAARLYLLLSAKQDYLATRLSLSDIEKGSLALASWTWELGSLSASSSLSLKGPMAPQKSDKTALWEMGGA